MHIGSHNWVWRRLHVAVGGGANLRPLLRRKAAAGLGALKEYMVPGSPLRQEMAEPDAEAGVLEGIIEQIHEETDDLHGG